MLPADSFRPGRAEVDGDRSSWPRPRKAVIPAAGLGTRFLPLTKAMPKEMLPFGDRPAIQHVVEEAAFAGLTDILLVTGRGKLAIEDHFDRALELEDRLERLGRHELVEVVRQIGQLARIHYVRQTEPLGLGDAIRTARDHIGSEPFAVLLADDVLSPPTHDLEAMIRLATQMGCSVVALKEVLPEEISRYGCAAVSGAAVSGAAVSGAAVSGVRAGTASSSVSVERIGAPGGLVEITGLVEKPNPAQAPSNLAVVGRYVLDPAVMDLLDATRSDERGEVQLTASLDALVASGQPVLGYILKGERHDLGTLADYQVANLELALADPDLGPVITRRLAELGFVRRNGRDH